MDAKASSLRGILVRMKGLEEATKLKKSTLYKLQKTDPGFPRRIPLGNGRARGYLISEIEAWIQAQADRRMRPGDD